MELKRDEYFMKKSVTITLLIFVLLLPCYIDAKETEVQKYQSTVIIDPSSMDDETRAAIISSIAVGESTGVRPERRQLEGPSSKCSTFSATLVFCLIR